jgi:hypothetical protein
MKLIKFLELQGVDCSLTTANNRVLNLTWATRIEGGEQWWLVRETVAAEIKTCTLDLHAAILQDDKKVRLTSHFVKSQP